MERRPQLIPSLFWQETLKSSLNINLSAFKSFYYYFYRYKRLLPKEALAET